MSLVSTRREYWREDEDSIEAQILGCAGFDDIAPIAVYLNADLKYKNEAEKALKQLKKDCGHIPEIASLTPKDVKDGELGFDAGHVYNRLFEMIAEGYGTIAVDKYGAWGYIDECGNEHWGDDSGFFPWYLDEETLEKDLEERAYKCGEEKQARFEEEMERGVARAERTHPITGEEL